MENNKAGIVMVVCQLMYSGVNLSGRAVLLQGLSSQVFVVYRQLFAFLFIAPLALFLRRGNLKDCRLGWKSFWMIFLLSFVGVTLNQNLYYEGLYLSSSTATSALGNLMPAITFVMAYILGLETVQLRSLKSMAKVIGTVVCVSGAVGMALFKGPKLLNMESIGINGNDDTWLLGCLCLVGNTFCWSLWLIMQVRVSACYPDHLSLTVWMCLMAVVQSGAYSFIVDPNPNSWILDSPFQIMCCLYVGLASAVTFFAQTWCIAARGPVFCAMFNPLNTVIVSIFASTFMHEELHIGSMIGAFAVIIGLYIVLWGKSTDLGDNNEESVRRTDNQNNETTISTNHFSDDKIDLEEPLFPEKQSN